MMILGEFRIDKYNVTMKQQLNLLLQLQEQTSSYIPNNCSYSYTPTYTYNNTVHSGSSITITK